jgi:prepilin-type N-terminal cleavage/methylation domain-containing protein
MRNAHLRGAAEAGFTLIELVVALTLITIGVFGYFQVFYDTQQFTLASNIRTRATALANQEIDAVRAIPYVGIGMDATIAAGATYHDTDAPYSYVTGGSTAPAGTTSSGGTTFSVQRAIVWVVVGSNVQAYKRCVVILTWTDQVGKHTLRQDDAVYPGGLGPASTSTSTSTSTTAPAGLTAPTALAATPDATSPSTQINLSWTAGTVVGTYWEVQHALTSDFANTSVDTLTQPVGTTAFAKSALGSSTPFYFRVRAVTGTTNGPWSPVATASTTASPQPACSFGTANVTPASVNQADNGSNQILKTSLYVSAQTNGQCTALQLRFLPSGSAPVTLALTSQSGGVWDVTIGESTYNWDIGTKTLTVTDGRGHTASISLLVCNKGKSCP